MLDCIIQFLAVAILILFICGMAFWLVFYLVESYLSLKEKKIELEHLQNASENGLKCCHCRYFHNT